MERDLETLLALPAAPYDASDKHVSRVSSLSLVRYRTNDYSVPVAYGHMEVLVRGYVGEDQVVVAGNKTLQELKDYRDDITHWWTDTIDENFLADLQRTINELIHRKYF